MAAPAARRGSNPRRPASRTPSDRADPAARTRRTRRCRLRRAIRCRTAASAVLTMNHPGVTGASPDATGSSLCFSDHGFLLVDLATAAVPLTDGAVRVSSCVSGCTKVRPRDVDRWDQLGRKRHAASLAGDTFRSGCTAEHWTGVTLVLLVDQTSAFSVACSSWHRGPNLVPYHRTHDYPTDGARRHRVRCRLSEVRRVGAIHPCGSDPEGSHMRVSQPGSLTSRRRPISSRLTGSGTRPILRRT